jgi:hypothetical protein
MEKLVEGLTIKTNSSGGILVAFDESILTSLPTHSDGKRRFLIRQGKGTPRAVVVQDRYGLQQGGIRKTDSQSY